MAPTPPLSPHPSEPGLSVGSVPMGRFDFERAVRLPVDENGLSQKLRLLALTLATYSNGTTGVARVSRPKLMEACVWKDHKSLTAHIKLLVKAGFVDYTPGGKGHGVCSVYQLTVPMHLAPAGAPTTGKERSAPPQVDDAEIKEPAALLYEALQHRGAIDMRDQIPKENQDWPRLHGAVVARLRNGWDYDALMLSATEPPLVNASSIRTTVCRFFASRIDGLGRPRPDQVSAAGAAQLTDRVQRRAEMARVHERLNALGPERFTELVEHLSPPLRSLFNTGGITSVRSALLELLDQGMVPEGPH